jgi:hypothetical protein
MLDNKVLRSIFQSKRAKITGRKRKCHNQECYKLYCSPRNIKVFKSGTVIWERHVACMGEINTKGYSENMKGNTSLL